MINDILQRYIDSHTTEEPEVLKKIASQNQSIDIRYKMISGHYQGRVLAFLSKISSPKSILEIGTYVGYSTICLAEGLQENGKIITIEKNERLSEVISANLRLAGIYDKTDVIFGDAKDVIGRFTNTFDLIFLDGDKKSYPYYYKNLIPLLSRDGLLIIDNVLWRGKVVDVEAAGDRFLSRIKELNNMIKIDKDVEKIVLPIRDGLFIVRKK